MNKKFLLFIVVACLMVLSAGAQSRKSDAARSLQRQSLTRVTPQVQVQEMQMRTPGEVLASLSRSSVPVKPFYRRPAGAFSSLFLLEGDDWWQLPYNILLVKPYCDYTYIGSIPGIDENDEVYWDGQVNGEEVDLTVDYGIEICDPPMLTVYQPEINRQAYYQYPYYREMSGIVVNDAEPGQVFAVPDIHVVAGLEGDCELLQSSKTMCQGGRDGTVATYLIAYNGCVPFEPGMIGRWFGKNGGHFDGMAQAFEKPEHPYLLKNVCIMMGGLICTSTVNLTCKVYRIDEIPAYRDDECVELSENSWELIATGRATLTTGEENSKVVTFTLFDHDEDDPSLEYEVTPTIDDAILIVFEGYNDPECDGLHDFTCYVSADIHADEGYGELAYIKRPINDENGNFTGQYKWKGLNNFFSSGEMKTGYTIFIVAEQPFLAFYYPEEDGEFVFPREGGIMEKPIGEHVCRSIDFRSWIPSIDDGWTLSCNGDDVPDWLEIELTDGEEDGCFNYLVTAEVTAEPLPEGVNYRQAVVRFEIPGAYLDYKFIQGETVPPDPCFPEITIAVVNRMIDLVLEGMYDDCYDVNEDGELNIADVNALINYILTHD